MRYLESPSFPLFASVWKSGTEGTKLNHPKLEVTNLLGPQLCGVFAEVFGKPIDVISVGVNGAR